MYRSFEERIFLETLQNPDREVESIEDYTFLKPLQTPERERANVHRL